MGFWRLLNPRFLLPSEVVHKLAIFALKNGLIVVPNQELSPSLNVKAFNSDLRTPIGLAAGFDKNGEVIKEALSLGFGFVEVGTVTKKPQSGNRRPRLHRLISEQAIINSLGFNNKGVNHLLKQVNFRSLNDLKYGINIGKNKNSKNAIEDYTYLVKMVYGLSSYITVNISSPNTPGLRDLQNKDSLDELLTEIMQARKSVDYASSVPILLKISPDIDDKTKSDIASLSSKHKVGGLIISNTTIGCRHLVSSSIKGGMSGKPLFDLSTKVLSEMYQHTKGKMLLVGCGGVMSGADAYEKIKAGATLVQLYTALVYKGFRVVNAINLELANLLKKDGFSNVSQAVGSVNLK